MGAGLQIEFSESSRNRLASRAIGLPNSSGDGQLVFILGRYYYPRTYGDRELYNLSADPMQKSSDTSRKMRLTLNRMGGRLGQFEERYGKVRVEDSDASLDASQMIELKKLGYGH